MGLAVLAAAVSSTALATTATVTTPATAATSPAGIQPATGSSTGSASGDLHAVARTGIWKSQLTTGALPTPAWHSHPAISPTPALSPSKAGHSGEKMMPESDNWSGEIDTGSSAVFSEISADWTVPTVAASASSEQSATWIGIDGVTNSDLLQTGTAQNSGPGGGYFAWVEELPYPPLIFGSVSPGDQIQAEVLQTAPGIWMLAIKDVTIGALGLSDVTSYYPPQDSAEWIEEAPSTAGGIAPLADFGTAQFSAVTVGGSGLSTAGLAPTCMIDTAGVTIAYPGPYDQATASFPIYYGTPAPQVTTVSPNSGPLSGGTGVTIQGNFLGGATAVDFGGASTTFSQSPDSTITATAPPGSAGGTVDIMVTTPGGTSVAGSADQFTYVAPVSSPPPPPPVTTSPNPTPAPSSSGYDMVGADGGVFVFPPGQSSGFYGSLPGLGIHVSDIKGMVPSPDDKGYYLVGQDGGVFAFGDAHFANSLPGLGVSVHDIVGIVPTTDDGGYFLVGADGGVFAFGDAPFLGSLPQEGIHRSDIIGIAATPSDQGYWVIAANGTVYAFGSAPTLGSVKNSSSPVSGIASTPDGGGYWVVTAAGGVYGFGDASYFGSLPGSGVTPARPVIGLVPTSDQKGYWLIGSDGGIFAYGDAGFEGSLPGVGVDVSDVVGAVPTTG